MGDVAVLLETLDSRRLRRLLTDWDGWRRGRELPSRRDFGPEDLKYLLGHILLLDVLYAPVRFRYRLTGSTMAIRRGFDPTGRMVDEHPDPVFRDACIALNQTVVARRWPQRWHYRMPGADGRTFDYEVLNLPLSSDGTVIDMILAGQSVVDEA